MVDPKFIKSLVHTLGHGAHQHEGRGAVQVFVESEDDDVYVNLSNLHEPAKEKIPFSTELVEELTKSLILNKFGYISRADNNTIATETYKGRANYKNLFNEFQQGALDVWYKYPLYNRVDLRGNSIISDGELVNIKPGSPFLQEMEAKYVCGDEGAPDYALNFDTENTINPIYVFKFVGEAFGAMVEDYKSRKKSRESPFLMKIEAKVGQDSENYTQELHSLHLNKVYKEFYDYTLSKLETSSRIKNLDDFYEHLSYYVRENPTVFSYVAFNESVHNNIYSTSVVIDVHDGDIDSDQEKIRFYDDPNFPAFSYVARRAGFKIDPNIPWRLIADVNSKEIIKYIANAEDGVKNIVGANTKRLYEYYYEPLYKKERLFEFVNNLLLFYNAFISSNPFYVQYIQGRKQVHTRTKGLEPINMVDIKLKKRKLEKQLNMALAPPPMEPVTKDEKQKEQFRKDKAASAKKKIKEYDFELAKIEDLNKIEAKYVDWYAEIRNYECNKILNKTQLKKLQKTNKQIFLYNQHKKEKLLDELVQLTEVTIGNPITRDRVLQDIKSLTTKKSSVIFLYKFLSEQEKLI